MAAFDALYSRDSIRMTPGRIRWSAWEIGNRLTAEESSFLLPYVRRAEAEGAGAHRLVATRKQVKKKLYGELAKEKDTSLDLASKGVFGLLVSFSHVYSAETEQGKRVSSLLEAFFPAGLEGATNIGYADELEEVKRILALAKGELAADVAAVPGLEGLLAVMTERAAEFAEVIRTDEKSAPSHEEAKAAVEAAERRMSELVMAILVHHHGDGAEASSRRAALLEPYENQQASMRQRYRRRQSVAEVDPETGEVVEPDPVEVEPGPEAADRAEREPAE